MEGQIKCYARSKEILSLLSLYGPLSSRTLMNLMTPAIKERRLLDSLARLKRKEFIQSRFEKVFAGTGTFYQITQAEDARSMVSKILNCNAEYLKQPQFSYRELLHSQSCAVWCHYLKRVIPSVRIVRDYEFKNCEQSKAILQWSDKQSDLSPDLLLLLPNTKTQESVTIAVEIEKSRKSDERLLKKISKFANSSLVDGVIYLCDTDYLAEVVRQIYKSRVLYSAHRIKQYANNFFMFSNSLDEQKYDSLNLYNAALKNVSLLTWTSYLTKTYCNKRRDHEIETSAGGC